MLAEAYVADKYGYSHRKASRLVGLCRATLYYQSTRPDDSPVRARLRELAEQRLHEMLKREGLVKNHKRTERLYAEEKLSLRLRKRKKRAAAVRLQRESPTGANQRWSMDFIQDTLSTHRRFRALTVIDDYTRECLAIHVDTSIGGVRVSRVLEQLKETRGLPEAISVDNGPEFAGKALDAWAYMRGVKLDFIRPGKPVENCFIESFNGRFRDECLSEHWFETLEEARQLIETWRIDYNSVRPHSSLGNLAPEEFAKQDSILSSRELYCKVA